MKEKMLAGLERERMAGKARKHVCVLCVFACVCVCVCVVCVYVCARGV
jgi:hypothetical protein